MLKEDNLQQLFNDTVNNTKRRFMDPDLIYVMDNEHWYYDKKNILSKPFIFSNSLFNEPFMLIGTKYTKHTDSCNGQTMNLILKKLDDVGEKNNSLALNICKEIKKYCPNDDINKAIKRMRVEMSNYDRASLFNEIFPRTSRNGKIPQTTFIFGRYFITDIQPLNKKCLFIATWENTTQEDINYIVTQILNKEGNIFTDIYKINASGPMISLKDNAQPQIVQDLSQEDKQKLQDKYNIHLMTQQDKRNALADFRKTRDAKNAKKLGNMTQAQYNALRYVDENKIHKKKNIFFTESQIKLIKENMK